MYIKSKSVFILDTISIDFYKITFLVYMKVAIPTVAIVTD